MRGRDIYSEDPAVGFGAADTDLWVAAPPPVPPEWAAGAAAGSLLYAAPEPNACYWPEVGNGYLATVPGWGSMHVGGLFNGACGSTHKARLPSPVALALAGANASAPATVVAAALDLAAAAHTRRWSLDGGTALVDVRVWASRTRKHVLVADLSLAPGSPGPATFNITSLGSSRPSDGWARVTAALAASP